MPFIFIDTMNVLLRNYQQDATEEIKNSYKKGFRAPLLVLSTGSGKTVVFCNIAERTARKNHSVYMLVHRAELLRQTSEHLDSLGVPHGLIAPGHSMTGDPVQVASVQTLVRRIEMVPEPDLIVIDEAHHTAAGTWRKILERWSRSRLLGVTATPIRMDGKGLGKSVGGFFDNLIEGPSIRWLIDNGYLSQPICYAPPTDINLKGVRTHGGDYEQKELSVRMDRPTITGSAIEHYLKICPNVPAIVFTASVKHAEHVADQFNSVGVPALSLTGELADNVRKHRIQSLGNGTIKVLTSCDIISEGTDIPVVGAAIMLRPTQSRSLYLQQGGRVLRPYPGKKNAIILDHVGNCLRHGLLDDIREWSIDEGEVRKRSKKSSGPVGRRCEKCFAVYSPAMAACPQCGHVNKSGAREIKHAEGELREVTRDHIEAMKLRREQGMTRDLQGLLAIARARSYKPEWAHRVYNAKKAKDFQSALQGNQMKLPI